jgi:hypothetical protein
MQHVGDDMDKLFRSAAENYPLDTNSADWNKVLAALQAEDTEKAEAGKKNRNSRFLWLLVLLPLGFICNRVYTPGVISNKGVAASGERNKNTVTQERINPVSEQDNQTIDKEAIPALVNRSNTTIEDSKAADYLAPKTFRSQRGYGNSETASLRESALSDKFVSTKPSSYTEKDKSNSSVDDFSTEPVWRTYTREVSFVKRKAQHSFAINRSLTPSILASGQTSKAKSPMRRQKKFYAGIMGGIDATTVKFQKIETAGHDFGVLVGYQVNRKWSIEVGSFIEQKFYYSEGKYFNTSKLNLPPTWRIDDVSGNCKMIEVPLSVRYNFSIRKNSTWFSTLGASSYFMKQENYLYNYYYGSYGPVPHEKRYDSASSSLFSNISISGGYTHRLGKVGDLRIEPYIKVPISGIGTGKLPLFSTGIHVGVTKKF